MSNTPPARESHAFPTKRVLLIAFALLIWLFFLIRSVQVFTVGSAHVTTFNSDGAIVVLMSNEDRPITAYNTYYYGQDRFGAWPFLIAQLIHRTTKYHWSNHALFIVQTVWLFISVLLLSTMDSRFDPLRGLLFMLPLSLHVTTRLHLYELSQPYAWQITALLFSWWCLRRVCEYRFRLVTDTHLKIKRIIWGLLTFWFSLLAVLSSTVSGPALFFLFLLEVLRSLYKANDAQPLKSYAKQIFHVALPVAGAVLTEFLLRVNYHYYSSRHFGGENRTLLALDSGHLTENFVNQWSRLNNSLWWLIWLLPLLAFVAFAVRALSLLKGSKKILRGELGKLFLADSALLVIGTFGIGLINFLITVLVSHVRANNYSERFLTISYLFFAFSGLLTLPLLAEMFKRYSRALKYTIAVIGLAILLWRFPAAEINPEYPPLLETALGLSQKAPGGVLLGGYWQTYVFAALDPNSSLVPVPADGETLRTPWTVEKLKRADLVIVEHHLPSLGGPESPAPSLVQYGTPLRLVAPKWYVNGEFVFSLYKNEARQP